jgi:hypothetical protein
MKWLLIGALASTVWAQDIESLKKQIQAQLDEQKPACIALFDHNDPTGHLQLKKFAGLGLPPRIQAYYDHGLLTRTDVHVQLVSGISGFLASKGKNAWRYDWAREVSGDVIDDELCYAYHRQVSEILDVKRRENGRLSVEYTWHYGRVSDWAKQPWLRENETTVWNAQYSQGRETAELP